MFGCVCLCVPNSLKSFSHFLPIRSSGAVIGQGTMAGCQWFLVVYKCRYTRDVRFHARISVTSSSSSQSSSVQSSSIVVYYAFLYALSSITAHLRKHLVTLNNCQLTNNAPSQEQLEAEKNNKRLKPGQRFFYFYFPYSKQRNWRALKMH